MRKLATIRKISNISPIDGADAIEIATVDGWQVVVKKNEFTVGDFCLYLEIDSFLPDGNPAWQFLVDKQPRELEGKRGHRLRSIKLRGALSQGFIVPLNVLEGQGATSLGGILLNLEADARTAGMPFNKFNVDLAPYLGIVKWDPPVPAELAGQVEGFFPAWMKKTDQERCQNLLKEIFVDNADAEYEVSLKLDGTSVTYYHRDGKVGVCSRNLEYKINEENAGNTMIRIFRESKLDRLITAFGNIAIQGELMGPGIQGNREKLKECRFYIFDIQNLDTGKYMPPAHRMKIVESIWNDCQWGLIDVAPILHDRVKLSDLGIMNVNQLLAFAEGPSITHPVREGLVFKRVDGKFSFKAIANGFLLRED